MAALDGVRILDLTRLLPGGYCTQLLADLGADVVKVEDTDSGDYLRWMPPMDAKGSVMFRSLNRNKRSVALDLKQPPARDAFLRMVARCDVVVESFRPGVLDRLGIGFAALSAANPRVVLCSITGYGQDGPYRDRAGHDINYVALAGVLGMSAPVAGAPPVAGPPPVPGVQAGDLGGGALHAAVVILAALLERERTGRGVWCDVSMYDGVVAWMAPLLAFQRAVNGAVRPGGTVLHGRHPCYRVYACADGYMSLGALEPKFWANFVRAVGLPELEGEQFSDGDSAAHAAAAIETVLRTRTRAEWNVEFAESDVCCEPVLGLDEVLHHAQAAARQLDQGDGIACPVRTTPGQAVRARPAPGFGEHTREMLEEAGCAPDDIDALLAAGAAR